MVTLWYFLHDCNVVVTNISKAKVVSLPINGIIKIILFIFALPHSLKRLFSLFYVCLAFKESVSKQSCYIIFSLKLSREVSVSLRR